MAKKKNDPVDKKNRANDAYRRPIALDSSCSSPYSEESIVSSSDGLSSSSMEAESSSEDNRKRPI